jgi:hypothetical protein
MYLRIPLFCDMMMLCSKLGREHSGQRIVLFCECRNIKEENMDVLLLSMWTLRHLEKPESYYRVSRRHFSEERNPKILWLHN